MVLLVGVGAPHDGGDGGGLEALDVFFLAVNHPQDADFIGDMLHRTVEQAVADGQGVSVANARKLEELRLYTVVIYPENGQSLGEAVMTTIREHSDKDLVKSVENGSVVFKAGPFENKEEAEVLLNALKALGSVSVSLAESD